ncbi:MAG: response regulator [Aristaeellaceae bacterium]
MNRNLLIVDDELEILQWLEELFRYDYGEELGVYTARSAREALEQLNRVRFDVVLTDIKMPGMDGITLFERIKENWPRCKTVFLTGYRNIDDLYRVMNHHDVQYILKAEGDSVILAAVRRAFEALEQEMDEARRRMAEDRHMEKARFWMRRDLIDQVFAGLAVENIQASMDAMGVELRADGRVQPYLLRVDNGSANVSAGEPALQMEYLIRSIRDNQPPTLRLYIHMLDRQYAAMLVQPPQDAPRDWSKTNVVAQGMLEYAQAAFRASRGMTFSAIVHPSQVTLGELPQAVPDMRMYMNQYVGSTQEVIFQASVSEPAEERGAVPVSGQMDMLMNLLELRKEQEYYDLLRLCLADMTCRTSRHDPQALETYYAIAVRLLQFINENHLNEQIAFKTAVYKLTSVDAHSSWLEAAQYLYDVSGAIFELLRGNESNLSRRLMNRVVDYIDAHLADDLTLTRLAQVGGFNASYLSRLFKQLMGVGVSDYILRKRMELARRLLADTNDRIQDVAARTGYLSAHSFTRAFRTETGISPTQWRAIAREGKK